MKDSFYFSHDSNSRSDEKLIRVRSKYGAKGYGIYFMLIEMLREANAYQLLKDYKAIAYEIREPEDEVKDIIENYNLFNNDDEFFWSDSLLDRMNRRDEIREKRQEAGKKGGLAKAKQNYSKCLAGKERKGKEIKGKEIKLNKEEISKDIAIAKVQYGNEDINKMLTALKGKIGIQAFVDSSIERNIAKHCVGLMDKIGRDEFVRRLDFLLADSFHSKNCNKIKYIYNNIKGFIEPKMNSITID